MRKIALTMLAICALFVNTSLAQRQKGESVLSLGMGLSVFNIIVGSLAVDDSVNTFSTPTVYLTYDYGLSRHFSVGLSLSHNRFTISRPYYSFIDPNGNLVYDPFTYQGDRINITCRPLYHWGSNEYIDWYTGLRLGVSLWNEQIVTRDPYYSDEVLQTNWFSFQALVGARVSLTEILGLSFEFGLGEPYLGAVALSVDL